MRKITSILLLLLLSLPAYSQDERLADSQTEQESEKIEIYFDLDSYAIDFECRDNRSRLDALTNLINKLYNDPCVNITNIQIDSYASPESGYHYNQRLTERRTNSIFDYLKSTTSVHDSLITKNHSGVDWDGLYSLVEESDMKYRDQTLHVIKNTPDETWRRVNPTDKWLTLVDSRNKHLMDLKYGRPYKYMSANLFPQLRSGSVVTLYFRSVSQPIMTEEIVIKQSNAVKHTAAVKPILIQESESVFDDERSIRLALKTNLLFDAATLINFEAEVPIGNRWSVAGEWIFPWWTWDDGTPQSSRNRIQLLQGNVMGKYWFGDRVSRPQMTGWFAGVYAGAGLYDFERNRDGVQGEFFIAGGLAGGYAHTINKRGNLRLEYSLGIGYLQTDYRSYTSEYYGANDWRAVRTSTGKYSWFGPTQAKVSLVWMLNHKVKKGGVR